MNIYIYIHTISDYKRYTKNILFCDIEEILQMAMAKNKIPENENAF